MYFFCLKSKYTYLIETKKKKSKSLFIRVYSPDFNSPRYFMIFAGFPPTTTFAGTLFVTTAPDAMTALSPIHTWFPMVTGLPNSMHFARSMVILQTSNNTASKFAKNARQPRYCIRNRTAAFLQKRHHFRKRLIIPLKWMFFFLADWFAGMQMSIVSLFFDLQLGFGHTRYIMFSLDHFFLFTFHVDPLLPFYLS